MQQTYLSLNPIKMIAIKQNKQQSLLKIYLPLPQKTK